MTTLPLSVLDLSPVGSGSSSPQALRNTLDLARLVDGLGYTRYWLAEHHNIPSIASSAPEILIGHVAAETTRIRVGSGGIMLPNHTPLKVVETFRVLEALHPGRIDLGIGRAPGTDQLTALALRRSTEALRADDFPEQLAEMFAFANDGFPADHPFRAITATPNDVPLPPVWLLGSSGFGAQLAASLGLGFAFAHHINPAGAIPAMHAYRAGFTPSASLEKPWAILGMSVVCADTDTDARYLAASLDLALLRIRTNRRGPLPTPEEALAYPYTPAERAQIEALRSTYTAGSPATVKAKIEALVAATGADEVMILTTIHDHAARRHSYELLAAAFGLRPFTPVVEDAA
ncbi:MAG TPA: LLM class flavin-dependent oxidoreductase [Thermomicrobiales bacterium]|jgi:luciferase family oxidoreductase group 1